jgi:hypothetical protein
VTAKTLLGFRRPCKFFDMTIAAFFNAGTIGTSCHVHMSGCPVTVHTINTFIYVIAMREFYNFLFHLIAEVQDL